MDEESGARRSADISETLSPREKQLLNLAERGFTDHAIANRLGISLATVGTYWGRIRIKFGPLSRTELVANYLKEEASKVVAALRTENERLISQVDHHSRTAEMLQTSLQMFQGLIETAPDAIVLVDLQGHIKLANDQAVEMFGYPREELLGMSVENLVPSRYREVHVEHRISYNENPVKRRMGEHLATHALRKDGSEFRMATALSASASGDGLLVTCIVRDLSKQLYEEHGDE